MNERKMMKKWNGTDFQIVACSLIIFLIYVIYIIVEASCSSNATMDEGSPFFVDFGVYYAAGKMTLLGEASSIYQIETHHAWLEQVLKMPVPYYLPWLYPPIFLLLIAPIAALPYPLALIVWLVLTLALALMAIAKILPRRKKLILLLCGYPGLFMNLRWGQNGFLSTALLGFGIAFLEEKPILSGIFFGLMVYKPQLAVFVFLVLLFSKKWKTFLGACLSAVFTSLLSAIIFGTQVWIQFFQSAFQSASSLLGSVADSTTAIQVSPFAVSLLLGLGRHASAIIQGAISVFVLFCTVWVWNHSKKTSFKGAMLALGIPLANPYFVQYDLVILAIPLILLTYELLENGSKKYEVILMELLFLLPALNWPLACLAGLQICPFLLSVILGMVMVRVKKERNIGVKLQQ